MLTLCQLRQILYDGNDLLALGLLFLFDGLCRQKGLCRVVNELHRLILLLDYLVLRDIVGAAPCRLTQCKIFVIAYLQVEPAGIFQAGGIRAFEHILTVARVLHAQTDAKLGVAPDLVIDHAGGLLRCKDQMDAQASADTGSADQLVHKFRLLALQFCKLVRNNEQVRQRLFYAMRTV